jgi:uncharacterized protein YgiM (DUF1202 family)
MKFTQVLVAVSMTLVAGAALAVETGTLSRTDTLRSKPFADAAVVLQVKSGAKVDIVSRNGGWYQVKIGAKTGWVRMLSVRRSVAASGSAVAGLASVASGRTGTGKVTTTTGVRGLDEAELKAAAFDEAQLKKAESYRVSRKNADAFAKEAKLVLRDAKPLPAPAKK